MTANTTDISVPIHVLFLRRLSEGNARGINWASVFALSRKTQFHYNACVKSTRIRRMNPRAHGFKQWLTSWLEVVVSLLDLRERNSMAFILDIRTKSHDIRSRPTLKLGERFRTGSVRELFERSICERSFTSEPSIEKYRAKHVNTVVYLHRIENPVEYRGLILEYQNLL